MSATDICSPVDRRTSSSRFEGWVYLRGLIQKVVCGVTLGGEDDYNVMVVAIGVGNYTGDPFDLFGVRYGAAAEFLNYKHIFISSNFGTGDIWRS